jgi:hypothetical protein
VQFADLRLRLPPGTCQTGTRGEWTDPPAYVGGSQHCIDQWTGFDVPSCSTSEATAVCTVDGSYQSSWKDMSILDDPTLNDSTFSYPKTNLTGWLCANTSVNCGSEFCQNNSAVEGFDFFSQVTTSRTVYWVDQCTGPETIGTSAYVPAQPDTWHCKSSNNHRHGGSDVNGVITPGKCVLRH